MESTDDKTGATSPKPKWHLTFSLDKKDIFLTVLSLIVGAGGAVWGAKVQATAGYEVALLDKKVAALRDAALEMNRVHNAMRNQMQDLVDNLDDVLRDLDSVTTESEMKAVGLKLANFNWKRIEAPNMESHLLLISLLFNEIEEALKDEEDQKPSAEVEELSKITNRVNEINSRLLPAILGSGSFERKVRIVRDGLRDLKNELSSTMPVIEKMETRFRKILLGYAKRVKLND